MHPSWLIVPTLSRYVPSDPALHQAAARLDWMLPAAQVSPREFSHFHFVCREQGPLIVCPYCGGSLSEAWFEENLTRAAATGFDDLMALLPCCQTAIELDKLEYGSTAAFTWWVIEGSGADPADVHAAAEALDDLLGVTCRVIWLHARR